MVTSAPQLAASLCQNVCSSACISLFTKITCNTDLPLCLFKAVSHCYLKCCLPGHSTHFAPNKTVHNSHIVHYFSINSRIIWFFSIKPRKLFLQQTAINLEKGMAAHSSALAWKIPCMEESGGLQSVGSIRVRHDWSNSSSSRNKLFAFTKNWNWLMSWLVNTCLVYAPTIDYHLCTRYLSKISIPFLLTLWKQ